MVHTNSPEVAARLKSQQRAITISSFAIALLGMLLIGLILAVIALAMPSKEVPVIVGYKSTNPTDEQLDKPKVNQNVQRKPSAPSSSMAKVIASTAASSVAVPVPEFDVPVESVNFGDSTGFGDGWGDGGGFGSGGGGATFFGQSANADRICYLIDYSGSMNGEREKLMRKELIKSLGKVKPGTKISVIFFAGPAWEAGDRLENDASKEPIVYSNGRTYKWRAKLGDTHHDFDRKGEIQVANWHDASSENIARLQENVREQALMRGTDWESPLEMAFAMKPLPQVIYLMTDGQSGENSFKFAETFGRKGKKKGVIINTISLMEPGVEAAMIEMAKRSGGQMSKVNRDGSVEQVNF